MLKNTAGQKIGAQMVSAADGSAFTGAVTVYITGDNGAQAIGSVGGGACAHKGNGLHNYAPAQAETNYDHIEFTFVGTGAIPHTVQIYTSFAPEAGSVRAALGLAAANLDTQLAAIASYIDTEIAALPAMVWAYGTRTLSGFGTLVADIWSHATRILSAGTNIVLAKGTGVTGFNDLSAAQVNAEADTALSDAGVTGARMARLNADIDSRLASADYAAPDNSGIATAAAAAAAGAGFASTAATQSTAAAASAAAADTKAGAIKTTTDKLNTAMEQDGLVYRFTANALEQAPAGGGGGGGSATIENQELILAELDEIQGRLAPDVEITTVNVVDGGTITVRRGTTWRIQLNGLGDIADREKLYLTFKLSKDHADSKAIAQWEETQGLLRFNGAAATAGDGEMEVQDEDEGDTLTTLEAEVSADAPRITAGHWDVKIVRDSGRVDVITEGELVITEDVTRATS